MTGFELFGICVAAIGALTAVTVRSINFAEKLLVDDDASLDARCPSLRPGYESVDRCELNSDHEGPHKVTDGLSPRWWEKT